MHVPLMTAIITHLLSQLSYRYIALPSSLRFERLTQAPEALARLHRSDWRDFLEEMSAAPAAELDWVLVYRKHFADSQSYILDELCRYPQLLQQGLGLVTYYCQGFPQLLREISDPPALLFGRGHLPLLCQPKLAIVGSRRCSQRARQQAFALARALALEEMVVVSGGAMGCDFEAHRGALAAKQNPAATIAVMAGGLSQLYPKCNHALFREILDQNGLFISERLWEAAPRPWDFPVRNRIISGLVGRVILIEASKRSGAMVTANLALEQGRDVSVLEPRQDIRCEGTQSLLEQGAESFLDSSDFLGREPESFRDFYE